MPKVSQILPWLDANGVALTASLAALVAAWKLVPAPTRARIELAFPRVAGAVRSIAAVAPDLVGFARVVWYQVILGIVRASVQPPAAQPPQAIAPHITQTMRAIDPANGGTGVRGFARPRALRAAVLLAVGCLVLAPALGALLAGCPFPPADGCPPLATRCSPDGVPQSCSPTQRWTSGALQNPCSQRALGSVCCRTRSPYGTELYACAPQSACLPETSAPDAGGD